MAAVADELADDLLETFTPLAPDLIALVIAFLAPCRRCHRWRCYARLCDDCLRWKSRCQLHTDPHGHVVCATCWSVWFGQNPAAPDGSGRLLCLVCDDWCDLC